MKQQDETFEDVTRCEDCGAMIPVDPTEPDGHTHDCPARRERPEEGALKPIQGENRAMLKQNRCFKAATSESSEWLQMLSGQVRQLVTRCIAEDRLNLAVSLEKAGEHRAAELVRESLIDAKGRAA